MRVFYSILIFCLILSYTAYSKQGKVSTVKAEASKAEASLSGVSEEEELDARIEEVQLKEEQEEKFDTSEEPFEIKMKDQKLEEFEEEIED